MITGRIYGLETEYGVFAQPNDYNSPGIVPEPAECVKELFDYMPLANRTTNYFLSNGARLYVDIVNILNMPVLNAIMFTIW